MKFSQPSPSIPSLLPLCTLSSASLITATGNLTLPSIPTEILGNVYNHWIPLDNKTFDLTRSISMPVTNPVTIPMTGSRKSAVIEPSRSALVIIDMQNYFLHPELSPRAESGRKAVHPMLGMIEGFRSKGMPVLWVNWGLDARDLLDMPPAFLAVDMGMANGTDAGGLLMRGSWNARPCGPLYDAQVGGVASGTDFYFHKNRLSGLWGAQTPLGIWLEENQITTLFFGGVNADQCVWGTLLDAFYKGYDVVYVDNIAATTSPEYATQMVKYNANLDGFISNSSLILSALA
ncbi:Isochorismatase hydrolase [Lojkania enalia]|uniref:Isochorismatase hydrolase n=1 Tax=Lojkania enalia TaxID=147567 RepID=A0A9P4JYW2_9PLEO|nr:Isochorismatase hydrolase [Didymosphaeria enalia]